MVHLVHGIPLVLKFWKIEMISVALLHATIASGKTAYEALPHVKGKGFALLPPPSPADVFFDMEGYPHADEGLEYLFGVVLRGAAGPEFKDWWAHDRREEQIAFEAFIDWVYAMWLQHPSLHIYHYASYEVTAMRRLACRNNSRIEKVDEDFIPQENVHFVLASIMARA